MTDDDQARRPSDDEGEDEDLGADDREDEDLGDDEEAHEEDLDEEDLGDEHLDDEEPDDEEDLGDDEDLEGDDEDLGDDDDDLDDEEDDLDDEELDDEELLEGDDEPDEEEPEAKPVRRIRIPARAGERGRKRKGPRPAHLVALAALVVLGIVYAVNGVINVQAREEVITRCIAEDARLEEAVAERSELRLPVTDWMVSLYQARRRYVGELCQGTIDELAWWRWNLGREIHVDISRATAQEITATLEEAAATCETEVRALRAELERHVAERGADRELVDRVNEVTVGQLRACGELRRAVMHSRVGFWPALDAESVSRLPAALAEVLPDAPEGYGAPPGPGAP